jgi:hypothetical protein
MYANRNKKIQESLKNNRMLVLFNTLKEEDKDIVIAMSDSLSRNHGIKAESAAPKDGSENMKQ